MAGTELHVLTLIQSLQKRGVTSMLACCGNGPLQQAAEAAGILTLSMPKRFLSPSGWRLAREVIHRECIDILHAHNGRTKLFAVLLQKRSGAKAIFTQHFLSPQSVDYRGPKKVLAGALHRWTGRRLEHTIAISNAVRQGVIQRHESLPERTSTVYNGISSSHRDDFSDPHTVHDILGVSPQEKIVLSAARLQKEKDLPTLVRAMAEVIKQIPLARCFIAGEGDLRDDLTRLISSLELSANVKLLGFRNDVPTLMNSCDVFVLSSPAEPFGLVVIEAMALKRAVVAVDAGGPREIIGHANCGVLVPPSKPEAMAAAIVRLLQNPSSAHDMGIAAYERFRQHFTADAMASSVLQIYEGGKMPVVELEHA
jgi:glycosyltransferase involved in cell wall biosynthesis